MIFKPFAEDVNSMGVRLRLYGCERMRRERLIGEAVVSFANINLELENNFWLNLEARASATVILYYYLVTLFLVLKPGLTIC